MADFTPFFHQGLTRALPGTFREAIRGIFPNIISILSDSGEEVRSAVLQLVDQMNTGEI